VGDARTVAGSRIKKAIPPPRLEVELFDEFLGCRGELMREYPSGLQLHN
jgi:hypothetical protein